MNDDNVNQELARLLRSFALKDDDPGFSRLAQDQFYQRLRRELDQFARGLANYNEEVAQVAMQEAWIKIIQSAPSYDPHKSAVKTWAKMLISQCVNDELRGIYKRKKLLNGSHKPKAKGDMPEDKVKAEAAVRGEPGLEHEQMGEEEAGPDWLHESEEAPGGSCPLPPVADESPGPDAQADAARLRRGLGECISLLPTRDGPNFRLAMQLCLDQDLSHADVTRLLAERYHEHRNINLTQVRGWIRQAKSKVEDCLKRKFGLIKKDGNHE